MGQGTESSETCADRPTEVSVIRFVSKNHTIEEIAPKKEVYICKQRGCGKIFTNQEEYKNHEILEDLKIRFICREPECGKELPDPGRMWWHYQEWHNNDTNVFVCPYTSCGSVHTTSENLEEHIESSHRQLPRIPTEPEIICFEGTDNVIDDDINRINTDEQNFDGVRSNVKETDDCGKGIKNEYSSRNEASSIKQNEYSNNKEKSRIVCSKSQQSEDYVVEQSKLRAALSGDDYAKNNESSNRIGNRFPKNKDLLITKENFLVKYEAKSPVCNNENVQIDSSQEGNTIFINSFVSLTKTANQEHRIELGNLEKVIRKGFERDLVKTEDNNSEGKSNCSDDEEYTPKKQRISRCKQEPYKCEINGCGKTYKSISQFRHHQDSHKLVTNVVINANPTKAQKQKLEKATTISFFICKMPGCGAHLSNLSTLSKHCQEVHPNAKPPTTTSKSVEIYRCKITGCEMEFSTSSMLCKHFNEVHTKNSANNTNTNVKTVNGSGVLVEQMFHDDTTAQRVNFKTDLKAKHSRSLNEFADNKDKNNQLSTNKKESGD